VAAQIKVAEAALAEVVKVAADRQAEVAAPRELWANDAMRPPNQVTKV
jgi:hypothetical protein